MLSLGQSLLPKIYYLDCCLLLVVLISYYPTPKSKISTLPQGEGNPAPVKFELNTADKITEKFDFVCANILHNVLAEIMGDLKNIMKDNAKMSLSGILDEKKPIVLEAIEREGLKIIDTISQDQWISFVVTQ